MATIWLYLHGLSETDIDEGLFEKQYWNEEIPSNASEFCVFGFNMRAFVKSDHDGDSITRRSMTGVIVHLKTAPIYWTSSKQTSIETSYFDYELIGMKQFCEYISVICYKLQMMWIPCNFSSCSSGKNKSVRANYTRTHLVLNNNSSLIAYHFVQEGVNKYEWITTYIYSHDNISNMLTKPLSNGIK